MDMEQKLLTDIELDVHELKCLMDSFSKEPTHTLSELLKRSIIRMQDRLGQLSEEVDTVQIPFISSSIIEECVLPFNEATFAEDTSSSVLGESIKFSSAGLRHSISLNDSFRFSREIFGGDSELMNRVVEQLSVMSSYKTAIVFLFSKVNINEEDPAMNDFLELLKKYFNESA